MKTELFIIIGSLLVLIVLFSGCFQEVTKKESKEELGDEILNIGEAVPEGWNYTITQNFIGEVIPASGYGKIITQNSEEMSIPHGLGKPAAVVNFTNLNREIEYYPGVETDKKYNPSLRLYFYNITEKKVIMETIDREIIYSWCVPIYFDETKNYIIVTSGCYINCGISTEVAKNYYFPLEKSLKAYFDKIKGR
jgi:hypothetical protein